VLVAGAVAALAGGGYAIASASGQDAAREASTAEAANRGLVARLPYVGALSWRCDREQRFFTSLALPTPGAGVVVSVTSDGTSVLRRRQVNPNPPPQRTSIGPFRALKTQTWVVRYHHKPATLRAVIRLRFDARRFKCLVQHTGIAVERPPH
jgi:hypothetical protein